MTRLALAAMVGTGWFVVGIAAWAIAVMARFVIIPLLGPADIGIGQRMSIAIVAGWLLETGRRSYAIANVRRRAPRPHHQSHREAA